MTKYLVITRLLVFLDIKVKMCKNFISFLRVQLNTNKFYEAHHKQSGRLYVQIGKHILLCCFLFQA